LAEGKVQDPLRLACWRLEDIHRVLAAMTLPNLEFEIERLYGFHHL
jgi:hypothetical protein